MSEQMRATGLAAELGAQTPIIAAPMAGGPTTPELVVSTWSAGGIGFLAGGYVSAAKLAEQIDQVRAAAPLFGVNLFVPNPVLVDPSEYLRYRLRLETWARHYRVELPENPQEDDDAWQEKLQLLIQQPVPVVSMTFGLPESHAITSLQRVGSRVLQTVTSSTEAALAQEAGVDGLIVQSNQAGGHSGTWSPHQPLGKTTTPQLVRRIRAESTLPIWAAGGIATPAAAQDAIAAGAEAVLVGTVLLRSPESGAITAHKSALADADHSGTVLTRAFSGRPARALRNEFTEEFTASAPSGFPAVHYLTHPLRKAAAAQEDSRAVNLWAGTGFAEASTDPAADIIRRIAGH
ncbi:NAD(P)H-dependent flavin oxidoreductase [Nesterenkonia haasae]|uniref:NAD(P)H-dependent flavin oxidoreductase n=1 Tax=Nesterenkonia haasae TaxID=2587813 RepID=UPI001F33C945|nr:nitronate monooxygenase [Nesterenkonia haasae]